MEFEYVGFERSEGPVWVASGSSFVSPGVIRITSMSVPLIISTWSFGQRGNAEAWPILARGGSSLDAVEAACIAVERDAEVDSVGFGGLPDAHGEMSLDACVMLSPSRCGSVCAVRRFMHPVSIARLVMEKTPHIMLAGTGADDFAESEGVFPADLLSADARDSYEKWKRDRAVIDQSRDKGYAPPRPVDLGETGRLFATPSPGIAMPGRDSEKHHDTIGVLAIDSNGVMAGACSTSGTPFKLPGRVGDSPIIGHGLYVDPAAGAAVATGSGELIMSVCGSFLAVEFLRRGASPLDAATQTLQRIIEHHALRPEHQVAFIVLKPDGSFASAALRDGYKTSVRDSLREDVIEANIVML